LVGGRTIKAGKDSSWLPERERFSGPPVWGLGREDDYLITLKYIYVPQKNK